MVESKGHLLVIAAMLMFGFMGIAAKYIAASPFMLLYWMQIVGAIFFFLVMLKTKKFSAKGKFRLILAYTFCNLLSDFSFFSAVKLTTVANAVFIKNMAPIFIIILAPILIKELREKSSIYAVSLSMIGLFTILYQNNLVFDTNMMGMMFALVTAVTLALFIILVKKITQVLDVYTMLLYRYVIGSIALTPLVLSEAVTINSDILVQLLLFGFLFAAIGTSIHLEGVRRIKTQHSGILGYLEPLSATIYSVVLFAEIPSIYTVIGGILIIAGTYIAVRKV